MVTAKALSFFMPASDAQTESPSVQKIRKSRYHPRALAIASGASLLFFAFACFIGFVGFTALLLLTGERFHGIVALALLAGFVLCRLLAFLNNRNLQCTLCLGTLLHEKRCRKHAEASRIPGLSYRAATVIRILFTGGFKCMYCGTPFRLRK